MTELEERIAHLARMVDELSAVVARQDAQITRPPRQADILIAREAERRQPGTGGGVVGHERPPHC